MPSFDIVSEVDLHQATNAVDQAQRIVINRFDFKGVKAQFEQDKLTVSLVAEAEFQVTQMVDILEGTLSKCGIDVACIDYGEVQQSGKQARQQAVLRTGLTTELGKRIVKVIKDSKLKVQTSIQGEKVRVTGKKRDDLQQVIALLKETELEMPLQYENFRD